MQIEENERGGIRPRGWRLPSFPTKVQPKRIGLIFRGIVAYVLANSRSRLGYHGKGNSAMSQKKKGEIHRGKEF